MEFRFHFGLAVVAFLVLNCAAQSQADPELDKGNQKINIRKDVAYGSVSLQRLDIYSPMVTKAALPILIFVHGGGWRRGDKSQKDHTTKGYAYTANNIIFIGLNYRLAPAVKHPQQIEDIASAFTWVHRHATDFSGDPNRIFLMGHSAGAHLVDLLATNDKYLKAQGLALKNISGVISLDTASLNLLERKTDGTQEAKLVAPMIDAAFGDDPKVLEDASPTLSIEQGKDYPPFLMFCGSRRVACMTQHKEFAAKMTNAAGHVVMKVVPLSHRDINLAAGQTDSSIFKDILDFVKR